MIESWRENFYSNFRKRRGYIISNKFKFYTIKLSVPFNNNFSIIIKQTRHQKKIYIQEFPILENKTAKRFAVYLLRPLWNKINWKPSFSLHEIEKIEKTGESWKVAICFEKFTITSLRAISRRANPVEQNRAEPQCPPKRVKILNKSL